jgi:hypothetical protein
MDVQVWPEFDQKAVLVFMNFSLPADVQLPATLKFAIPRGALIAGIGEIDPSGGFKYNYADSYPPVQPGADWDIVTIQVEDYRQLQIDYYYDPGIPAGAGERSFPLLLQLPLDVGSLELHVQEPARASDFQVQPFMQSSAQAADGFRYATAIFSEVKAGSTFGHLISYSKPDGALSTGPDAPGSTAIGTSTALLTALVIVVIVAGGLIAYVMYRNAQKAKKSSRRPRARRSPGVQASARTRPKSANSAHASTNREKAVGRFCFACGEELVKKARYCQSCGKAQDG